MIDPISVGGILLALGIAWWQNREAARAKGALHAALETIPGKVADALKVIVEARNKDVSPTPELAAGWPTNIEYADVDGDGRKELLVQYPAGAHGSNLKVFGWKDGEFTELVRLGVGTPVGFNFGDFDGDGKIEIRTEETDWSAELPYVSAPRVVLLYRWNGRGFEEVSRQKSG